MNTLKKPQINHKLQEEIAKYYQETQNKAKTAKKYNIYPETVDRLCSEMGIPINRKKGPKKQDLEDLKKMYPCQEIVMDYLCTRNRKKTAQNFGIHFWDVGRILLLSNVPISSSLSHQTIHFDEQKAVDLYESGKTYKEIAEYFHLPDEEVIRRRLVKKGLESRVGKAVGSKNPQWKGGMKPAMHYHRRLAYEIASICLKKPLPKGWVVHHLDENKENNHPTNLIVFPNASNHQKWHQTIRNLRMKGVVFDSIQMALELGGILLPTPDNFDEWKDCIDLPYPLDN